MNYKLLLLLFVVVLPLRAQVIEEDVPSRFFGTRVVTVVRPPFYDKNTKQTYPLIVLLDGEYMLDPVSGNLSYSTFWDDLPQAIIVGVTHDGAEGRKLDTDVYDKNGLPQGQGDQFYQFVANELIPFMEKNYRLANTRIVAGHDLTAGFMNFFLYKEKPVFNGYISFSPVMSLDMEMRTAEALKAAEKPVFYYLATADGDVKKLKEKINTLNENIKAVENPNLKYKFEMYTGATHYSLVPMGIPQALYFMFGQYQPISSQEYEEKILPLPSGYVDYLKEKYRAIREDLGINIPVRINDIKAVEAAIMKNGAYDELRDLADLVRKDYPKMIIGEFYEGMYYEMKGETRKAVRAYLKAYNYEPIADYTKDVIIEKAESLKKLTE